MSKSNSSNPSSLTRQQLLQKVSLSNPIHLLAFGFGSGLAPKAPGTFGSAVAIPLLMLVTMLGTTAFVVTTLLISLLGIWVCERATQDLGVHDHSSIVWDEVAGMFVAFMFVPITWETLILGFVLFRFFDIIKPWPIRWADTYVKGGFGIMLDDVLAGVMTLACLHLALAFII